MTSVPADQVFPLASPVITKSFDPSRGVGLLGASEAFETDSCPWPEAGTLLPATEVLAKANQEGVRLVWDIVDEWGDQSFPASDPPANW